MKLLFHAILIEPDLEQARLLTSLLTDLTVVVTPTATLEQAQMLLSRRPPDLLIVRVHPASARALYGWLPTVLTATPLPALLYAEHPVLLDAVAAALPRQVTTMPWPCSKPELARLVVPLLGSAARCSAKPCTPLSNLTG